MSVPLRSSSNHRRTTAVVLIGSAALLVVIVFRYRRTAFARHADEFHLRYDQPDSTA